MASLLTSRNGRGLARVWRNFKPTGIFLMQDIRVPVAFRTIAITCSAHGFLKEVGIEVQGSNTISKIPITWHTQSIKPCLKSSDRKACKGRPHRDRLQRPPVAGVIVIDHGYASTFFKHYLGILLEVVAAFRLWTNIPSQCIVAGQNAVTPLDPVNLRCLSRRAPCRVAGYNRGHMGEIRK